MRLSITLAAVMSAISASIAAPALDIGGLSALIPRGRIREQLNLIGADAHPLACHFEEAIQCFERDVKQHIRVIKGDLHEDFGRWKSDVYADFKLLFRQLNGEIEDFKWKYYKFKDAVKNALFVKPGETIDWAQWDLRFHLALMWQVLGDLQVDARQEIYELLTALSADIHVSIGLHYTEYPESCTAVLTQIETVQRYYGSYIDFRTYKSVLLDIHEKVYAAAGTTKATFRYDNYQN